MINRSEHIDETALSSLHPFSIRDRTKIRALLDDARKNQTQLSRGLNHRADLEIARISSISADVLALETSGFRRKGRRQIFLNFESAGRPYFFSTEAVGHFEGNLLSVSIPTTIYCSERRDRTRRVPSEADRQVQLLVDGESPISARLEDSSPGGLGISVPSESWNSGWRSLRLRYRDNANTEKETHASVRSQTPENNKGWTRIGLAESTSSPRKPIEAEVWDSFHIGGADLERIDSLKGEVGTESSPTELVTFPDRHGHHISGYLDRHGREECGTSVILHTGWGETKETLLPLALTIVETFKAHGESVSVLRIDGINQRGESYKDPDCRLRGREYNRFVFSQGVDDIDASVAFMRDRVQPERTIIVSQSVAALAARKAIVRDENSQIDAWVSIVGSPDLQSVSRAISGGIDFAVGFENGIEFGYQELLGIVIHADRLMRDATDIGVLHIEDARQDFDSIEIPLTWFHGHYDAWVDFDRVKDVLSYGKRAERKLIVIPTAHRLGWSQLASQAFLSVANEVARLATGRHLEPVGPDPSQLARRRAEERNRRPKLDTNLRAFWKDYLLGRDGSIGIELMTACDPYGSLMSDQIDMLRLNDHDRVLDLGCGTGSLATELLRNNAGANLDLKLVGLDHIPDALKRARDRARAGVQRNNTELSWLAADLDVVATSLEVPLRDATFDAVLASLLLSYLERPDCVLSEIFRILRPGGRVVVSSLLKDADISRLYVESVTELQLSDSAQQLPELGDISLGSVARNFLNDASKILDLEAEGSFVFWEPSQLCELLESAGFVGIESRISFGNPGQAVVVGGYRPNTNG
jgi:ubiquinone/menaquinone biosynthesis C-methylase UbiE/pimeloyl-ACP methyl ester carboxylesterase